AGCVLINLTGTGIAHFWTALVLLGIGWNFLFVGGTTLLTETYTEPEKAKTQGLNDFLVFTTITVASLSAGATQHYFGWRLVNLGVIPLIVIVAVAIVWLKGVRRVAPQGA
ncbi:MAG: MFS transporter, partial [Pseudomonadota bacterium]